MLRRCLVIVAFLGLVGCATEPTAIPPTVDLVATQIAVEEAAHATMTARAPKELPTVVATNTSEPTATTAATTAPTNTPTNSPVPTATDTPEPTNTPKPTATRRLTSTPAPTATPVPTETFAEWKKSANKDIEWRMVDKSDAYYGERVCWRGKVFNIAETQGTTFLQAWYFEDRSHSILDDGSDAFVVNYDGTLPKVFEDTPIEVCGYVDEQYIGGQNAYGGPLNQPQISGVYVEKFKPKAQATARPKPPYSMEGCRSRCMG